MTPLLHELATFLTLGAASAFLVWHFSGLGRSGDDGHQSGCSRCDQRMAPVPVPSRSSRAVRSKKLNVLQ